jgi:pimeloyl-ACP methyl ester carboxylesterase
MTQNTPAAETPANRARWQRALRTTGIIVASVVVLTAASAISNVIITGNEHATLTPYGQKVTLDAGDVNVYRNGGTGPTMVLLSGFGTPSPAIDFAPLIRELDSYDVIVIEGFGYGLADTDVPDRSVENITSEIHQVLAQLDVNAPVILLGHSVGGLYTHYYANAYPGEVSAIIGIDPMTAKASSLKVGKPSTMEGTLASLGLFRIVSTIAPDIIQPPGAAYTKHERELTAALTNWNYGNASNADEWARIGANSTTAAAHALPADVPVLQFLSTQSIASDPSWLPNHQAEIAGVTVHELDIIDGPHYLHWENSSRLARAITAFLTANLGR